MKRKVFILWIVMLVCLLGLVSGRAAEGARTPAVHEGVLLGGMMGKDGSVAVLRGVALEGGPMQIFLDYTGNGSDYAELLGEVAGTVAGGMLMGCGDQVWVVVQVEAMETSQVYRWGVEGMGEAWVCGVTWEVFLPAVGG